jgi:hypothetical protein
MNTNNFSIKVVTKEKKVNMKIYIYVFGIIISIIVIYFLIKSINKNIIDITDITDFKELTKECKDNTFELSNSSYCGTENYKKSKLIGYSMLILLFFISSILFIIGIILYVIKT